VASSAKCAELIASETAGAERGGSCFETWKQGRRASKNHTEHIKHEPGYNADALLRVELTPLIRNGGKDKEPR